MMQRKESKEKYPYFSIEGKKVTTHNDPVLDDGLVKGSIANLKKITNHTHLNVLTTSDAHSMLEAEIEKLRDYSVDMTGDYPSGINMKLCIDECYEIIDTKMLKAATNYINLGDTKLAKKLLDTVYFDIKMKHVSNTEVMSTHDLLERMISPTHKETMAESRVRPEHLPPLGYN